MKTHRHARCSCSLVVLVHVVGLHHLELGAPSVEHSAFEARHVGLGIDVHAAH